MSEPRFKRVPEEIRTRYLMTNFSAAFVLVDGALFYGDRMVEKWCIEQFGNLDSENPRWDSWQATYYFRDEVDAVAFRLRWC